MKLIIDIPDEVYYIIMEYQVLPENIDLEYFVIHGTTLEEELEKIKTDIQFIADKCLPNNLAEEFEVKGLKTSIEIIDKHIAKLKGEQE